MLIKTGFLKLIIKLAGHFFSAQFFNYHINNRIIIYLFPNRTGSTGFIQ